MTDIESIDPKALKTAVDAIARQNEAVERRNAKCFEEGNSLKHELSNLAHNNPAALAKYVEANTDDFEVLFDSSGHISGYRTYLLGWFHSDQDDKDLRHHIEKLAGKRVELCKNRSR